MKVISPAGEFEITINDSYLEDDHIVLKGEMGVWDSKIYLKPKDLMVFLSVLCKSQIILFFFKLPIQYVLKVIQNFGYKG